jgi:MFS family permease
MTTSTLTATTAPAQPTNSATRVATASFIGTAIEFYDFYVYATAAALVIGPVFFPQTSGTAQMLSAFLTFGIAFLARPLGSALFGHFGDRIGRKSTLVASLLLMGVCTTLIGVLPGYDSIGAWAPILLCVLRFGQGLGLAVNGAAQRCWPRRTRRKANAPGSACSRSLALRLVSSRQRPVSDAGHDAG